jgi:hypothetical protein
MRDETPVATDSSKLAAGINLLLGIWFFVSPWIYGAAGKGNAWNSWIVGALVVIVAATRVSSSSGASGLGWINMIFGAWIFASPWIYGYTANSGRFINSLCVGIAIFLLSIYSASAHRTPIGGTPVRQ